MKLQHESATHAGVRDTGFSLVEVMVALIVMSVGLLGVAKMQALALSSTTTSRMRSLVALEAASLASTTRADRAYWSTLMGNTLTVTIAAGAVSATDKTLTAGTPACTAACTAPQIAANDLNEWAGELNLLAPGTTSVVTCTPPPTPPVTTPPTPPASPVSCQIVISWTEKLVASNAQQATQEAVQGGSTTQTSYTIYVDP